MPETNLIKSFPSHSKENIMKLKTKVHILCVSAIIFAKDTIYIYIYIYKIKE